MNGFARVTTDRRIQIRFAPSVSPGAPPATGRGSSGTPRGPTDESLGLAGHRWYGEFLSGLSAVGIDGTAGGLRDAWREEGLPPILLSKTGTLNEPGEATPSDDLFSKSLLFALGPGMPGAPEPLTCGIVGGLYLRFKTGPRSGNLPSYQVEFARRRLGDFLKDYWEEFGACPGAGREG